MGRPFLLYPTECDASTLFVAHPKGGSRMWGCFIPFRTRLSSTLGAQTVWKCRVINQAHPTNAQTSICLVRLCAWSGVSVLEGCACLSVQRCEMGYVFWFLRDIRLAATALQCYSSFSPLPQPRIIILGTCVYQEFENQRFCRLCIEKQALIILTVALQHCSASSTPCESKSRL